MIFDGDRDKLGEYIREMANLVGLRDWSILLMDAPPEDARHAACIQLIYGQKRASLFVAANWMERSPDHLRQTLVHELLHCHINPIRDALEHIHDGIGDMLYYTTFHAMNIATEYAVDAIATEWAESLPLPILDEAEDAA